MLIVTQTHSGREAKAADEAVLSRYVPALDGVRGIAIAWVVLHNTTDMPYATPGVLLRPVALSAHIGWMGVELFFALSGFLITAGLLATQGTPKYFSNFYSKRALRILPLYYITLFVVLVVLPRLVSLHAPFSNEHQAPLWLFLNNWVGEVPYGFAHFWSLAVEEQFYLVWPLLVYRLPARQLLRACLWIAAGTFVLRCVLAAAGASWSVLYTNTACRMDALALGGAAACVLALPDLRQQAAKRSTAIAFLTVASFLVGIPLTRLYDRTGLAGQTIGYTILAVCSAAFVLWAALPAATAPVSVHPLLSNPLLRSMGRYSYAMYVFHGILHKLVGEPWLVRRFGVYPLPLYVFTYALAMLALNYALGFCSYYALERPFLQLKQRFQRPVIAEP